MTQGWNVSATADTVTFLEAVPSTSTITVNRYATAAYNQTDLWAFSAWNPGFGYPREVEFYSDRLIFAASYSQPQTLWMSKVGDYRSHGRSTPSIDSDGIVVTINARQVNKIQDLIPMESLIIMTTSAEVKMTTGADQVVAPGKVGFSFQSFYGSSKIAASVVGDTCLFLQGRGTVVRDLGYQFTKDGYTGNDLSIYASHLLEGFEIVDWAFQQVPYCAIWIVRSDGALLCLTYLREQEVVGWSLHTTEGKFTSVCCVPEGQENALYVGVLRPPFNYTASYVERLHPRDFIDQRDAFFVDAGLTFDGRARTNPDDYHLRLETTVAFHWDELTPLRLKSDTAIWSGAGDVGDHVRLISEIGGVDVTVEVVITAFNTNKDVTVHSIGGVPDEFRAGWSHIDRIEVMRDTIAGLDHLEGLTVAVLADGSVQKGKVVVGGQVVLDYPAAVVHVGLPYRSDIETLDINVPGQETVRDRPKLIGTLDLIVKDSRGLKAGPDLARLEDIKTEFEAFDQAVPLFTGVYTFTPSTDWNRSARIVAVQDDPLPATILGIIPHVTAGGS
jgi:hypothetical protein